MWQPWRLKLWLRMLVPLMILVLLRTGNVSARLVGESAQKGVNDAALELTTQTFNSSLWAAPATAAIVEFYAHWCPACQNFKPQYDRIAHLFNGVDAVYPGVLIVAKVDCADEINKNLCQRFSIKRYPTMLWGKPATFAWGSRLDGNDKNLEPIESKMNAQSLLEWINTRLVTSYSLDTAIQKKQLAQVTNSVSGQMVASIYDIEEATAEAFDIILNNKLVSSNHRAPFVQFLQLLSVHHPSRRCRVGSAHILFNLMEAWPAEHILEVDKDVTEVDSQTHTSLADIDALKQFHICGEDLPRKKYKTCNMATGGYSCGLWYLFHALSVRVDDLESRGALKAICQFIANFFICEECREHFLKMSKSAIDTVSSRRDLTLWLWHAHNEVNSRLSKGELTVELSTLKGEQSTKLTVELSTLKVQWPPQKMCAACRIGSEKMHGNADEEIKWDEDKVYHFLRKIYGQSIWTIADEVQTVGTRQLDELNHGVEESMSSNAMTAPVGAAVGIAMASCGFGVAACCWRVQQKKRKHFRRRI